MHTQDWFPLGFTDLIPLLSKYSLKSLLQCHNSKAPIFGANFFMVQLLYPYVTTGKTIALTILTFISKIMSQLKILKYSWQCNLRAWDSDSGITWEYKSRNRTDIEKKNSAYPKRVICLEDKTNCTKTKCNFLTIKFQFIFAYFSFKILMYTFCISPWVIYHGCLDD